MHSARIIMTVLLVLLGASVATAAQGERAPTKIGVLMFSGEVRYQEALQGFVETLARAGYAEPRVRYLNENAGANKGRAHEIVRKFAAEDLDLILTLGTSATTAVVREIRDVPVVFSVVYDPVEAGIARDWKSSGNNTTGVSSKVPIARPLEILQAFRPVKRLAVLYTPGERNSEIQLRDLQLEGPRFGIRVVPVPLATREEIPLALPEIVRTSDALFLTGSNLVDSQVTMIVQAATKEKVVTLTHLEDLVVKGVLLGCCFDPHALGIRSGEKAVRILKGARPSSIPIETAGAVDVVLNRRTARMGGFEVPPAFRARVTRSVD